MKEDGNGKVHVRLACIVLAELVKGGGSLRRFQLEKQTYSRCGTRATFDKVLAWLRREGFVAKAGVKHTAPYIITDKGKIFLEAFESEHA